MISLLLLTFVLTMSKGSDISELFQRGFGLDNSSFTKSSSPDLKRGKVPQHLADLMKKTPDTDSNRFVSKRASWMKISHHKVLVTYNLAGDEKTHGDLQEVEMVVHVKTVSADLTIVLSVLGSEHHFIVSSQTRGLVVLPLKLTKELATLRVVDIEITAHQVLLSSHGVEVSSTLAISRILNLKQQPQLVLHYRNTAIIHPSAGAARRQIIKMFGETRHQITRRSTSYTSLSSHCQVHELIVNFANIGLNSVIAPVEFNARLCSGECHVDHAKTPMTNHAFIKNLISYSSGGDGAATCVSDRTAPLTVLVAEGKEFHLTVYEDMIVESCSCR